MHVVQIHVIMLFRMLNKISTSFSLLSFHKNAGKIFKLISNVCHSTQERAGGGGRGGKGREATGLCTFPRFDIISELHNT